MKLDKRLKILLLNFYSYYDLKIQCHTYNINFAAYCHRYIGKLTLMFICIFEVLIFSVLTSKDLPLRFAFLFSTFKWNWRQYIVQLFSRYICTKMSSICTHFLSRFLFNPSYFFFKRAYRGESGVDKCTLNHS